MTNPKPEAPTKEDLIRWRTSTVSRPNVMRLIDALESAWAENERLRKADKVLDRLIALDEAHSYDAMLQSNHNFANRLRTLLDEEECLKHTLLAVIKEWDKLS